jgi:hypothetical protein
LNWQSDCIVSNPIIFKGEAIQVLLHQKISISKAIVSFQTPEVLSDEAIQVLLCKKFEPPKRLYVSNLVIVKGEVIQVLLRQKI